MNTKRAPKVRFKGFTDAWELRKFESIAARASSISADPTLPRVEYEDIISGIGLLNKDVKLKGISKPGIVFNQGDILYGKLRPYLHNWFLPSFSGLAVGDFWVLQPKDADSSFLFRLIQGQQFDDVANQSIGTKMPRADWNLVSKTLFFVPTSIDEQALIGRYFRSIDNLITLHQRKLDKMKELKKTFLNLIFSQKLRFRGFTDSWELRKLGEITEKITRKNQSLESLLPLTISAQHGLIDQNSFFNKQIASKDVSGYYLIKNGEFAYNKSYSNAYPWGAIKRLDLHDKGVLSTLYIVFKPTNVESNFLVSYYSADNWHKEVSIRAAEGARNHGLLNISPQDFFETKLLIPNKYEEQEKIGVFFKKLDNLIIFNQDKINRLKNVKKILLRNMLI